MADAATPPIRVGIIGFGTAGQVFHAPLLAADPEFSVSTIVTSDPERTAAARAAYPSARIFDTPATLFDEASDLDLVVIASPPHTHTYLADQAMAAGLDVIVDKPYTVTAAEGRRLSQSALDLGRKLTVFQNRRWDADFLTIRRLIADGELGDIFRFESNFEWWKPHPQDSWKSRAEVGAGGGILYDLGAHLIDQALVLFGPPESWTAQIDRRLHANAADDDVSVSIRHRSGVTSALRMSSLCAQSAPRFRVLSTSSAYVSWGLDPQEDQLARGVGPDAPGYGRVLPERWGLLGATGATMPVSPAIGAYDEFYRRVADWMLRAGPPPVDLRDAVQVIEIIESLHARNS